MHEGEHLLEWTPWHCWNTLALWCKGRAWQGRQFSSVAPGQGGGAISINQHGREVCLFWMQFVGLSRRVNPIESTSNRRVLDSNKSRRSECFKQLTTLTAILVFHLHLDHLVGSKYWISRVQCICFLVIPSHVSRCLKCVRLRLSPSSKFNQASTLLSNFQNNRGVRVYC